MRRLIDKDPNGIETWHHFDHGQNQTIIESVQDVEPILNRNKALANEGEHTKRGIKSGFWHVASIPIVIIDKWLKEDGLDVFNKEHAKKVKSKLQSPEYRYLCTTTKRW